MKTLKEQYEENPFDWYAYCSSKNGKYDWSENFEIFSPSVTAPTIPGYSLFIVLGT